MPRHERDFFLNQCYNSSISNYPMSEDLLKAFLEKVQGATSLQKKLKSATGAEAVVEIAKEAGFSISADDINKAQSEISDDREISDEELEGVAGGGCQCGYCLSCLNKKQKSCP